MEGKSTIYNSQQCYLVFHDQSYQDRTCRFSAIGMEAFLSTPFFLQMSRLQADSKTRKLCKTTSHIVANQVRDKSEIMQHHRTHGLLAGI